MKISLSWLKEYISVDLDPQVISEKLTMAGLEVESVEKRYDYLENVVVGKVLEVKQHPNADKLTCCRVDAGQNDILNIICGAPNVKEDMMVPCALPGAELPGNLKIKKSKIRGEKSEGMLCSSLELRLDSDASGIMDLNNKELVPGTPVKNAIKLDDYVFEIDLTPNRPDCLSAIGVAREIAAFPEVDSNLALPDFSLPDEKIEKTQSIHDYAKVDIIDPDLCPRYSAGLLVDVKIGPSPFWLQEKLESVGLTPVNNVVDITNFVMLETGQPLHAFDFDNVGQQRIEVKRAGNDITFTTLDSKAHKLESEMLMICDGEKPVAIAGVMGGENSEISETTTRVLIESAYFNHVSIRRTAKRTGIATDASHRFERGIDPEGTVKACKRAMALIADICKDSVIIDGIIDEYPQKSNPVQIDLSVDALNIRLGTELSTDAIKNILESVEFETEISKENYLSVKVPSFRVDVSRPEDLSEEVARLWGYNNIQTSYPLVPAKGRRLDSAITFKGSIRDIMNGFGFSEAINYNFIDAGFCDKLGLGPEDFRRNVETILNPISEEMSVLRSTLIPGLLDNMRRNISMQTDTVRLFETGKVFLATKKGNLPEEKEMFAGLMTGLRYWQSWHSKKQTIDFFDLKGICEGLFDCLNINDVEFKRPSHKEFPYFAKGHCAIVKKKDQVFGVLGKVNSKVLKSYALKQDAYLFEFHVDVLQGSAPEIITARLLPKFPSVPRDITIIVDKVIEAGKIVSWIKEFTQKEALVESVHLFDVFEGEPLEKDKKSISFRIIYRSSKATLKEKVVKGLHTKISQALVSNFDADLPK